MKVLFINDSTSNPNWGDRAAAISLKKMVTESGGNIIEAISEDELAGSTFLNKSPINDGEQQIHQSIVKETLKLFIPPLFLKIRQKIILHSNPPTSDDVIPQRWEDFDPHLKYVISNKHIYSDLLKAIEKSDLLVIHGDGCMTGCGRIPRAELFLSYIVKKHFEKPVIIVNHSADFSNPVLNRMAQEVYPLFDDVVYRDVISVERNRKLCNGRFAPDSAYYFKPISKPNWLTVSQRPTYFDVWPDTAHFKPAEPYICIGGSGIYYYNRNYDAVHGFSLLVEHIRSIYSGQIVLTVSDLRDQGIFRPIAIHFNLPLIGLTTPVQQSVDIMGNADAYIGGRWHPSIFALRGGTPIISISSNTFMMQALAEMSGLSPAVFDALNLELEKEAIGRQLKNHLEQENELRIKLRKWAEKESEKSWDNVTFLKNMP
jgi:polysaccharide pyruvyl transferase WcaK-like protein